MSGRLEMCYLTPKRGLTARTGRGRSLPGHIASETVKSCRIEGNLQKAHNHQITTVEQKDAKGLKAAALFDS